MHFFNVGFNAFLTDAVAFHERATVFSSRNALAGLAVTVFSVVFGGALVLMPFPINYQVVLSVGLVFALLSSYHLTKVQLAPRTMPAPLVVTGPRLPAGQRLRAAWRTLSADKGFVQISINTFLHGLGMWGAGPLYTLYILRELKLGENWIGVTTAVTSVVAIFSYMAWRRIMARWGEPKTLKVTIMLLGLYPLLTGLTGWLPLILFAAVVNGFISAGTNLSHFNTFLRVIPTERVHSYTAINMTVNNIGVMLAPIITVALANQFGFGPVLVGCGVLTILGSCSFLLWPVGDNPPAPVASTPETASAAN
jgi:Na+/melibiose symporter-like transporter